MEDILNFENRDLLYEDLMQHFNLKKVDEKYYEKYFGDFYVTLLEEWLLIRYVNERSYLTIRIASQLDSSKWSDLFFLIKLISNAKIANAYENLTNKDRIAKFNQYLVQNFETIKILFDEDNYQNTLEKLDTIKKDIFLRNFNKK